MSSVYNGAIGTKTKSRKLDETSGQAITQAHSWLLCKESLKSRQLLRRRGMPRPKSAEVEVADK